MRGQKQRHEIDIRTHTNRHLALKEGMKPNAKIKMQRQKVPDEDIDINKLVQGDRPKRTEMRSISLQSSIMKKRPKD